MQKYIQKKAALPNIHEKNIESVATDLDQHARSKLPDGTLKGILAGYDGDIRQHAILMALRWWSDHQSAQTNSNWHPRRSICYALRYAKLQYAEKLKRRDEVPYDPNLDLSATDHPYRLQVHDYPPRVLLEMLDSILSKCLRHGSISPANALIAQFVYAEGRAVTDVANTLGIHRSAVYQQLRRVRIAVRDAAETTDPTFTK